MGEGMNIPEILSRKKVLAFERDLADVSRRSVL